MNTGALPIPCVLYMTLSCQKKLFEATYITKAEEKLGLEATKRQAV